MTSILNTAAQHRKAGRTDDAEQLYQELLARNSRNPAVLNDFGALCRSEGRHDEAIALYKQALKARPNSPVVHHNLGNVLFDLGQYDRACHHYRRAFASDPSNMATIDRLCRVCLYAGDNEDAVRFARILLQHAPNNPAAHRRLGSVLMHCRRLSEAREAFEASLHLDSDNQSVLHLVEVLAGNQPEKADPETVRAIFDKSAEEYEEMVVRLLKNRTPQLLRSLLERLPPPETGFSHILDLACGTGLMGLQTRPLTHKLVGVDLSPGMVKQAQQKNIYDQLEVDDLVSFLAGNPDVYDLISCSDALIYLGDLKPLFDALETCSRPGTLFLFSTEKADGNGYNLEPSSYRFRHSHSYITEMLTDHDYELIDYEVADIRVDRDAAISGGLYLAVKR